MTGYNISCNSVGDSSLCFLYLCYVFRVLILVTPLCVDKLQQSARAEKVPFFVLKTLPLPDVPKMGCTLSSFTYPDYLNLSKAIATV